MYTPSIILHPSHLNTYGERINIKRIINDIHQEKYLERILSVPRYFLGPTLDLFVESRMVAYQ